MKSINFNGITINVSDAEYKNYLAQTKAKEALEKNARKLNSTKTKSVAVTYSDYVTRALAKGAEILYLSDVLTVVAKGDVVIAENNGFNKKVYYAIKKAIQEYGGKWCGNHEKKVFTYKFDRKHGEAFVAAQKARA